MVILKAEGQTVRIDAELAATPEQHRRGLMYRKELADNAGMLFLFDSERHQSFWMKNTYIPLDMIFINSAGKVVGIVHEAEPLTTDSRAVSAKSRYVLEVNGGFAKRHNITTGTMVAFDPPLGPR